jgi:MFS family permease
MFIMPTSDAIVSDLANPKQMGSYFGVSAFVFGAGESLGNIGGGQLMQYAVVRDALAIPWIVFGVVGVLLALTYYGLTFWQPLAKPLSPVLEERVGAPSLQDLTEGTKGDARMGWKRKQRT